MSLAVRGADDGFSIERVALCYVSVRSGLLFFDLKFYISSLFNTI